MSQLPCINCITLPICRNQYQAESRKTHNIVLRYFDARRMLENKCRLLFDYTKDVYIVSEEVKQRRKTLQEFMDPTDDILRTSPL